MNFMRVVVLVGLVACGTGQASSKGSEATAAPPGVVPADQDEFLKDFRRIHHELVIEKAVIGSARIPAYLVYMKDKAQDIKPGVILVHGHDTDKTFLFTFRWPVDLAYMGYAVVAIDAWGHGERDSVEKRRALEAANWFDGITTAIFETAKEIPQVHEFLAAQPQVDGGRVGLMGMSMGGCITLAAAAMENPIAAFVPFSSGCDYIDWAERRKAPSGRVPLLPETRERILAYDPIYFPEQIAPKPLLFVHGRHDVLMPIEPAQRMHRKLLPLYEEWPDHLGFVAVDSYPLPAHREPTPREVLHTHYLAPGMTQAAYDFLEKHVKGAGSESAAADRRDNP